jgi:hypothetical protein
MNASDVAEQLRNAYARGFAETQTGAFPFFAETVDIRHLPPSPLDGPRLTPELQEETLRQVAAMRRAVPDLAMDTKVDARGEDTVIVASVMSGTLPDGATLRADVLIEYELAGGKIVRSTASGPDPATMEQLRAAMTS